MAVDLTLTVMAPAGSVSSGADRLLGLLLFLPVPLVLWLFTRQALGTLGSLADGLALTATHRLYARPFARSRGGWASGGSSRGACTWLAA